MPRYYFHVEDGKKFQDLQGTELADVAAARAEALRFAGHLLSDAKPDFWDGQEWTMRVTNENDLTLFTLMFIATNAAAAAGK